jgi:hypothetical protein
LDILGWHRHRCYRHSAEKSKELMAMIQATDEMTGDREHDFRVRAAIDAGGLFL